MAWTTPLTAASNATLTAAQWNASVRDNLAETAPAKATTAGRFFATAGANTIVERVPSQNTITASDQTAFTSYVDLNGGAGPLISVVTGPVALVAFGSLNQLSTTGQNIFTSYAISGATTVAASDQWAMGATSPAAGLTAASASRVKLETGLTSGTNTFTLKYRVSSGTATISNRNVIVIPF